MKLRLGKREKCVLSPGTRCPGWKEDGEASQNYWGQMVREGAQCPMNVFTWFWILAQQCCQTLLSPYFDILEMINTGSFISHLPATYSSSAFPHSKYSVALHQAFLGVSLMYSRIMARRTQALVACLSMFSLKGEGCERTGFLISGFFYQLPVFCSISNLYDLQLLCSVSVWADGYKLMKHIWFR